MKCEGWRRHGGALSFGKPQWVQCDEDATVMLKIVQQGAISELPGCNTCWKEAIDSGIEILSATPL